MGHRQCRTQGDRRHRPPSRSRAGGRPCPFACQARAGRGRARRSSRSDGHPGDGRRRGAARPRRRLRLIHGAGRDADSRDDRRSLPDSRLGQERREYGDRIPRLSTLCESQDPRQARGGLPPGRHDVIHVGLRSRLVGRCHPTRARVGLRARRRGPGLRADGLLDLRRSRFHRRLLRLRPPPRLRGAFAAAGHVEGRLGRHGRDARRTPSASPSTRSERSTSDCPRRRASTRRWVGSKRGPVPVSASKCRAS